MSTAPRPTLLIADDDPLILATLGHVLRNADFDVIEAQNSAEALAACLERKPALAIIDYALPGTNGVELARLITNQTATPLMFLSAYKDESIVQAAIAAGAMAYLIKPIDTLHVLPAIRTALQRAVELNALRSQADQLNLALQSRRAISVATGLVMARFQIGQQEALERMRRMARSRRTRLETFAGELVKATDDATKLYEALNQGGASPQGARDRGSDA